MSDLRNALFKQIETSRVDVGQVDDSDHIDDSAPTAASSNARRVREGFRRYSFSRLVSIKKRLNRTQERDAANELTLPARDDSWDSRSATDGTDLAQSHREKAQKDNVVLSGWLHKTSRPKWTDGMARMPHEHRQHRRFKLTEHSLEYNHLLQRV